MATTFFTPTFNSSKQLPPALYCAVLSAPSSSTTDLLLQVKDLSAVIAQSKQPILKGVNLTIRHGEFHAVMEKNGSGKSTFAKVLKGEMKEKVQLASKFVVVGDSWRPCLCQAGVRVQVILVLGWKF